MARGLATKDGETEMGWESGEMGVVHIVCHEHEHECRGKSVRQLMALKVERCHGSCCCRSHFVDDDDESSVQGG